MKTVYFSLCIISIIVFTFANALAQEQCDVIILEQPKDVVECVGSVDQYLFVKATASKKQYDIAYRWLKDDRPISNWTPDLGQLTFDSLKYSMSGLYQAEFFAFDPNWTSNFGNSFDLDSARVSAINTSSKANLYVLQPPSFIDSIKNKIIGLDKQVVFTFDAHIYGEHNMDNPSYWTDVQWYKDSVELTDNDRFSGTKSSILTIQNILESDYSTNYRVRLIGNCDTIWSNKFALHPEPELILKYITHKSYGGLCINRKITLQVGAGTIPSGIPIDFQWYLEDKPIYNDSNKFEIKYGRSNFDNIDKITLTLQWHPDYENNMLQKYYCEFWPRGFKNNSKTLQLADFRWHKPIELIKDLEDEYTVAEGEDIELSIEAKSNFIIYQWFRNGIDAGLSGPIYPISRAASFESGSYQVKAFNECGEVWSKKATLTVTPKTVTTSVTADNGLGLEQNYPNPVVDNSTIKFTSEVSGQATLTMTDMMGNTVANIFNGNVNANKTVIANINSNELNLTSGAYFVTLRIGDRVETIQISVIK